MSGSASCPCCFFSCFSFCCSSFTCCSASFCSCSASLTFTSCFASSTSYSASFTSCSASFTSPCPPHAATPNIEVKAAMKRMTIFLLMVLLLVRTVVSIHHTHICPSRKREEPKGNLKACFVVVYSHRLPFLYSPGCLVEGVSSETRTAESWGVRWGVWCLEAKNP